MRARHAARGAHQAHHRVRLHFATHVRVNLRHVRQQRIEAVAVIEEGVTLSHCTIGPNVSIGSGSHIERSELTDTIVGHKSVIRHSTLAKSLIGDQTVIEGVTGEVTVGDHSEVRIAT